MAGSQTRSIVGIADYFGAGNIGDDLMVAGLLEVVAEAQARAGEPINLVLLCPHRQLSQIRRFPEVTWCRPGIGYEAALADADLLTWPGDTPFQPQAWVWDKVPARVAVNDSCPLLCLAVGAEEPAEKQFPAARALLGRACLTTTRDETSAGVLRTLAPASSERILVGSDLANISLRRLFPHRGSPPGERSIPLAVLWYSEKTSPVDTAGMKEFVTRRSPSNLPVFLSHECRMEFEHAHFRRIFPRKNPRPRFIRPRYYAPSVDSLVAPYREIGTVVASRYHSVLAAAWAGCRVAALPRSLKVQGIALSLDIPAVDAPITADALERAVGEAQIVPRAKLDDLAEQALESGVEAILRSMSKSPRPQRARALTQRMTAGDRILVVRQDSIGDAVLTTGMLRELRRSRPSAIISLVTSLVAKPMFTHCPYIDHLIAFDFSGWGDLHQQAAAAALFSERTLRPMGFDIAVLPRYDFDYWGARAMVAACGAPMRVGYAAGLTAVGQQKREMIASPFTVTLAPEDIRHEADRSLALVGAIGGTVVDRHLELWPQPSDRRHIVSRMAEFCGENRPLIALAPGASAEARMWPIERFISLGRSLVARFGASLVIVGGTAEREAGSAIAAALRGQAIDLTGQLSLNRSYALIEHCDLLISNDSAPVHFASAATTAVVVLSAHALDGDDNGYMSPRRFGAYMTSHRTVQPKGLRAPCSGTCSASTAHCILGISVEDALNASLELLREWPEIPAAAQRTGRDRDADEREVDGAIRFWQSLAEKEGAGWKETRATSKLKFLLQLIGRSAQSLRSTRVLVVNDGPLQTLDHLNARVRVAVDPKTDSLIRVGLLDPDQSHGKVSYLSESITENTLPERIFDIIFVSHPVHGPNECLDLLRAVFRVAERNALIALNLYGFTDAVELSLDLIQRALGGRAHADNVALLKENKMTIRGSVNLLA